MVKSNLLALVSIYPAFLTSFCRWDCLTLRSMPRRKTPSFWIYNEYRNEVLKSIFYKNLPVYMTMVLYYIKVIPMFGLLLTVKIY